MRRARVLALWVGCASGVLLASSGCGALIGIKDVPGADEGGTDGTVGHKPDGGPSKKDGGSKNDGKTPDTGPTPDGPSPDVTTPDTGADSGPDAGKDSGKDTGTDAGVSVSVLEHHMNRTRDGHYIDPLMTKAAAALMKIDATFNGAIQGPLWSQPLYVENGVKGNGTYYVADDNNNVYAIDETTGLSVWSKTPLVMAAGKAGSGCGNVQPVGVTGTPIIDTASRTMYLTAAIGIASGIQSQQIYALSIDDGSTVAGWPINVNNITATSGAKVKFNPQPQGQRSALALVNGYLYVSFGGEDGDCGNYHGWVVSVPVATPASATGFATTAQGGGMWAVGGISSDGTDVFAVSGNATVGTSGLAWASAESEALLRFHNGSAFDPTKTTDFFTPSNWQSLDGADADLVGAGPLVVDVPGATPSALVIAMGKSGVMHLLDRANLGGVGTGDGTTGEGLYSEQIGNGNLRGAAAAYTTSTGTYVVVHADGGGKGCAAGSGDLVAVQITATKPPTFKNVWCASSGGNGSPIVTTTDAAGSNAIVWIVGTEGSNKLTGWDGETGMNLFNGGPTAMDNVIHWTTLIDVKGRLIVGSNDKLYAFTSK